MVILMTRQTIRTHWDPALGTKGKAVRADTVGSTLALSEVLETPLVPVSLGPHFFGQLVIRSRLGDHELTLDFREFHQATDDVTHLSEGVGAFRKVSALDADAWSTALAQRLGCEVPHISERGQPRVVPVRALYYGVVEQSQTRWEVFTLSFGAGLGGAIGMRICREQSRIQWFDANPHPEHNTLLSWELHHALHGVQAQPRQVSTPALLESTSTSWSLDPMCEVKVGGSSAWFLGPLLDDEDQTGFWSARISETPTQQQHWPWRFIHASFAYHANVALCAMWDDTQARARWMLWRGGQWSEMNALVDMDLGMVALNPQGTQCAVLSVDEEDRVDLTVWSLEHHVLIAEQRDLLGVDGLWGWSDAGLHLSGEDDFGRAWTLRWRPDEPFDPSNTQRQTTSPDGQWSVDVEDYALSGTSWRCAFVCEDDFYDLSTASASSVDTPRWIGQHLAWLTRPAMAIDAATGQVQPLFDSDVQSFDALWFGPQTWGVIRVDAQWQWVTRLI